MRKTITLFRLLFPIYLRMYARRVKRWFVGADYKMAMDDLYDTMEIFKIRVGVDIVDAMKGMTNGH